MILSCIRYGRIVQGVQGILSGLHLLAVLHAVSVRVRVRRDKERNGPIGLFFARIMGLYAADVGAERAARRAALVRRLLDEAGTADALTPVGRRLFGLEPYGDDGDGDGDGDAAAA